ncbi:MAG: S41 family peptidase [Mariniblastus sp.]
MIKQAENAMLRYRRNLEKALAKAPSDLRSEVFQDADEFLLAEVMSMDVGRLTSENAAFERLTQRFGTPEQLAENYFPASQNKPAVGSKWVIQTIAAFLLLGTIGGVVYSMILNSSQSDERSPFTRVDFRDDGIVVKYGGKNWQWLEIEKIPVERIVTTAKKHFPGKWQRRIAEDLVKVMATLNHKPEETVQLRLRDLETGVVKEITHAPMTHANRRSVWETRSSRRLATADLHYGGEFKKSSPFTKVAFVDEKVFVEYNKKTWQWLALDDFSVEAIKEKSNEVYGGRWQKRISEDLFELLVRMDHKPGETVRLRLLDPASNEELVVAEALMSEENRRSVKQSAGWSPIRKQRYEKLSPFTKVTFEEDKIFVEFENKRWQWLALDDLRVAKIEAGAKKLYQDGWKKRVSEDLVEVLGRMGHTTGKTVRLRLLDPESNKERIVKDAPMTKDNRRSVLMANIKTEDGAIPPNAVASFHEQLKTRWAYYPKTKTQIDAQIERIKGSKFGNRQDVLLAFQKVLARGVDGHAGVRGQSLSGRCSPFLIESIGDRYVAFNPDRNSFVSEGHPYIDSIDGVSIDDWCKSASVLVAKGSPQLVKSRSLRLLRHIDHWRKVRGLGVSESVTVELSSKTGDSSVKKTIATLDRKPTYGEWPRSKSKTLRNNIGYLRIPSMDPDLDPAIRDSMTAMKSTDGLIVDVRGNGGGTRDALRLLASYFMSVEDSPRVANVAKYRLHPDFRAGHLEARFMYPADAKRWSDSEKAAITKFAATFKPEWEPPTDQFSRWHYMVLTPSDGKSKYHYDKPIVVLSDADCFSATDIFLAGLKGMPGVTIIGAPSGGGSARSVSFRLRGSTIETRIASMASFQPDGKLYDGNGVSPDEVILPSPEYFLGTDDPVLSHAIKLLATNAKTGLDSKPIQPKVEVTFEYSEPGSRNRIKKYVVLNPKAMPKIAEREKRRAEAVFELARAKAELAKAEKVKAEKVKADEKTRAEEKAAAGEEKTAAAPPAKK